MFCAGLFSICRSPCEFDCKPLGRFEPANNNRPEGDNFQWYSRTPVHAADQDAKVPYVRYGLVGEFSTSSLPD
jgi:hypothetical protein